MSELSTKELGRLILELDRLYKVTSQVQWDRDARCPWGDAAPPGEHLANLRWIVAVHDAWPHVFKLLKEQEESATLEYGGPGLFDSAEIDETRVAELRAALSPRIPDESA